jgi:hypothetical protein
LTAFSLIGLTNDVTLNCGHVVTYAPYMVIGQRLFEQIY